jgi:predicted ATPase with chaperone activity
MPGILPEIPIDEVLDVICNYSVADALSPDMPMICTSRVLHHTISRAGLATTGSSPAKFPSPIAACSSSMNPPI